VLGGVAELQPLQDAVRLGRAEPYFPDRKSHTPQMPASGRGPPSGMGLVGRVEYATPTPY
jgi:hypothetical protein